MRLRPGTLIALEGLDGAGKTTQADRLAKLFPDDLVIHSPSGTSELGSRIYQLTERHDYIINPMGRQLLHLASHCEMYDKDILPALRTRGVFMDRNWWSTVAYGWSNPEVQGYVGYDELVELAQIPARGVTMADHTFVFMHPYVNDPHNTAELLREYWRLVNDERPEQHTVFTYELPVETTTGLMTDVLEKFLC